MRQLQSAKIFDWSLVVVVNLMWATQVPVIRLIGDRLGPVAIAFVPLIVSTVMFLPLLVAEKRKRSSPGSWRDVKYFILPGVVGIFTMQYAYTIGSQLTLAANAGIITLTIPVMVALFASIMLKERLNIVRLGSFVLALIGVVLTSVNDVKGANFLESDFMAGNMIFLFACGCCAFYNTYCKVLVNKGYTELEMLVYCSIVGSVLTIPLFIWVEPFNFQAFLSSDRDVLLAIVELSLIVYGLASLLFFYVLRRMDVTQAILGNYLLPVFIALLGVLLLDEEITPMMMAGALLIFISTLMVTVYERKLLSITSKGGQQSDPKQFTKIKQD